MKRSRRIEPEEAGKDSQDRPDDAGKVGEVENQTVEEVGRSSLGAAG
jgi:hypothetical protein